MPIATQIAPEPTEGIDEPAPMERPILTESAPDMPDSETTVAASTEPPVNASTIRPETPAANPTALRVPAAGRSSMVRTSAEFRAAIARPNPSGTTTILLAPNADLSLPTIRLGGKHRWTILGASGSSGARPIVRFVPEPAAESRIGTTVSSLFEINHATLDIHGVDLVVDEDDLSTADRATAFVLMRDSQVKLDRCSVTILGETVDAAVFTTYSGRSASRPVGTTVPSLSPTVTAEDCLFRGEGDLVRISRLPMLEVRLTNSAVVLSGSLLHSIGLSLPAGASPMIELTLNRLHARTEAGMIHLESDATHPALPLVKADATDCVLTTGRADRPLIRIDGQENLDSLANQLDWRGRGVVYDDVEIYRRDQSALPGSIPRRFDRASWDLAVGMADNDSVHGNARLVRRLDPAAPLWSIRPRDLELSPTDEFAEERGPRLDRIAQPDAAVIRRDY
jgi:hypothetical protein